MPKLESLPNTPGRQGARRARAHRVSSSLAEINIVPLVDVMLVLLVIFMVAAPMMTQGFPVHLPQSRKSTAISEPVTVTVPLTFRRDKKVRLGNEAVPLDVLAERIRQALTTSQSPNVVLAGDGGVTLQELVSVFDKLIEGGVTKVGIQTTPPTSQERRP
ncbi:MAG TPA: biopolymer transporter ExbD [Vicinamibacterales bacterium]|nr:biopolymer transporter ExbD [Vicinamibacterales bacterium]